MSRDPAQLSAQNRYTVVCDLRGGRSVAQVLALDEVEAVRAWGRHVASERPIPRASARIARNVLDAGKDGAPTAVEGLEDVCCFTPLIGRSLMLCHVELSR